MKVILSFLGIIISIAAFGQSENKFYESFNENFKKNLSLNAKYEISNYIKPQFLISDLNGDNIKDIAVLIINKDSQKKGFVIYHPNTNDYYVIGAGQVFNEEDGWDNLNWIDFWKINTKRSNEPGIQGGANLVLKMDSIKIIKDEVGGGLIYWDGKKYNYFHQTC